MSTVKSSKNAKLLRDECLTSIPKRRGREILLLELFLGVFAIIVIYLWVNAFIYDIWFYLIIGMVLAIVVAGYYIDKQTHPDWQHYFLEILRELKGVDTVELSEFINEGQPFFGANLGNCEKFLKIADKLIEDQGIELVIRGSWVYLKGHEPPEEEEEEKKEENEEKDA